MERPPGPAHFPQSRVKLSCSPGLNRWRDLQSEAISCPMHTWTDSTISPSVLVTHFHLALVPSFPPVFCQRPIPTHTRSSNRSPVLLLERHDPPPPGWLQQDMFPLLFPSRRLLGSLFQPFSPWEKPSHEWDPEGGGPEEKSRQSFILHDPLSTRDRYNWRSQNTPFPSKIPKAWIPYKKWCFSDTASWASCQQLLHAFFKPGRGK